MEKGKDVEEEEEEEEEEIHKYNAALLVANPVVSFQ